MDQKEGDLVGTATRTKSRLVKMLTRREKRFIAVALKATLLATAVAVLFMPKIEFDLSAFSPGALVATVEAAETEVPVS